MWLIIDKNGWWFAIDSCKTEVLLRITIEHALKSDNLVNYLSKKASQKLNVVARIAPAVNASQLLWTDLLNCSFFTDV